MGTFNPSGRMTRVIVSLSTAVLLSGAGALLPQVASAVTVDDLRAQIAALQTQIAALQGASAPAGQCSITRNLTVGSRGDDVKCLQAQLNVSPQSGYFGPLTKAAVAKWQAANGVSPAAGYFGALSRAKYSSMVGGAPAPAPKPGTPTPAAPSGTGLSVSSPQQPGDSLAPLNASRLAATKVTLSASSDGDITVNSLTIERQGPAADSSIGSVILLDEQGLQIGNSKTLNSNHQTILNQKFTVMAGTSRTLTVAVNRPSSGTDGGSIAKMAVVAIDAGSAAVSGALPIIGSPLTMNTSLTIGTATMQRGVNDPGAAQTKEIGTAGYIFTAIRMTAGSAEDLLVKSVSFNQSGSAAPQDLKNVVINTSGTDYAPTVSADGKYYTASFGDGITVQKGNNLEFYAKGDVQSGSNRTVDFDLYRFTDIYAVGKSFGYGITPSGGSSGSAAVGAFSSDTNPAWNAYAATVGNGTLTVTSSTAVPAQNIAINLANQPLGAFDVETKGEPITVSSMVIRVSTNKNVANLTEADYTQVALYDNTTGKVIAGPLDGSGTADGQMIFTYTDAVSFPVGKRAYVLKGKLSTDFTSDVLVSASTTPNTDWTSIKGDVSGASITAANTGTVSGNSMTVKAGAVNVSLASTPQAQTVIRGAKALTFANIVFDGSNSGEDVRFTTAQVEYSAAVGNDLTNCQLFDGTTALNTGSNIVNPALADGSARAASHTAAAANKTFTLDTNLTVPKGTTKTVALKCDVVRSGTGTQAQWSFSNDETFGATGLTSGSSITPSLASSSVTNLMTLSAGGSLAVVLEPGGPSSSVQLAQAGQEVTVSKIRLQASNEDILLTQLALLMSNSASSSASDVVKYTLWDGATKVAELAATSSTSGIIVNTGTCAGCSPLLVQNGVDKIITIKTQLSDILGSTPTGRSGHLVTIDYDNVNLNGNMATYGVGQQSSSNVYATGADTASAGVRVVRSYPTVTPLAVPNTTLSNSTMVLYRFSVSAPPAPGNGISLYKVNFNVASSAPAGSSMAINSLQLFAFTTQDSGGNLSGGAYTADAALNNGSTFFTTDSKNPGVNINPAKATTSDYAIYFNPAGQTTGNFSQEAIYIPAGSTYYFELRGVVTVGSSAGTYQANILLEGDRAWYGLGNTSGGTVGYDNAGFLAGATNYGFATSAPYLDQGSYNNGTTITAAGGQGVVVSASQTWSNQSGAGANFIWSDNATTTHTGAGGNSSPDWFNGYVIPGLPTTGTTVRVLSVSK